MGEMEQSKKSTVSYGDCVINEYIYKQRVYITFEVLPYLKLSSDRGHVLCREPYIVQELFINSLFTYYSSLYMLDNKILREFYCKHFLLYEDQSTLLSNFRPHLGINRRLEIVGREDLFFVLLGRYRLSNFTCQSLINLLRHCVYWTISFVRILEVSTTCFYQYTCVYVLTTFRRRDFFLNKYLSLVEERDE